MLIPLTWCLPISPWLITDDCDDEQIYLYPMVTLETYLWYTVNRIDLLVVAVVSDNQGLMGKHTCKLTQTSAMDTSHKNEQGQEHIRNAEKQ
jgi:hypothetical protein